MKNTSRLISDNFLLILVILSIGILYHLSILPPVETGQDSVRKFLMMKTMQWDITEGFWQWNHHSARWSINAPIAFFYYLFPSGINTYYFAAWSAMLATVFFLYKLAYKYLGTNLAVLSALAFIFFSNYSRNANQLVPAIFSNAYILSSYYFLDRFFDSKKKYHFLLSIFLIFCAYLAKIDNLYFLPGFLITIYLVTKNWKYIFSYSVILFGLYILETGMYALFTDYPLGRLQVILGAHLSSTKLVGVPFLQLFDKILIAGSPLIYFLGFFFLYLFLIITKKKKISMFSTSLCICIFIYYFLKVFLLKKYNPLVPLEINKERYLLAPVPFLLIFTFKELYVPWRLFLEKMNLKYIKFFLFGLSLFLIGKNTYQYSTSSHQLQKNIVWEKTLNKAYANGTPIVSNHFKSIMNVYRFYLKKEYLVKDKAYVPMTKYMNELFDKSGYWILHKEGKNLSFFEIKDSCHIFISKNYDTFKVENCDRKYKL